jgi:hypothetical protein
MSKELSIYMPKEVVVSILDYFPSSETAENTFVCSLAATNLAYSDSVCM